MKHLIVLASLILAACGSNGGGAGVSQSNVQPTGKRVLFISDNPSGAFTQSISPGLAGLSVTYQSTDGYTAYQTLNGTNLAGAESQIAGWLALDHYEAVVFSIGSYEFQNDYVMAPTYVHQDASYLRAHAATFLNALKNSPRAPATVIYVCPQDYGGVSDLLNRPGYYGIISIGDAFGYHGSPDALYASIIAKLQTALN